MEPPRDTSPEVERVHAELLRRAGPVRRIRAGLDFSRSIITLSRRGLRRARPGLSEFELLLEWVAIHYGAGLAAGVRRRTKPSGTYPPADIETALVPLIALLTQLGVRYSIDGSLAASIHGEIHATNDVDVVADLKPEHAAALASALGDDYYADEESIADAIRRRSSCNLIHLATMLKVDLFVPKDRPFSRQTLDRSIESAVSDTPDARRFRFASREDIVLAKLEWYRKGGEVSERQWRDVAGVLRVQGDALDLPYLRQWAAELRVADLLERALAEAGRSG